MMKLFLVYDKNYKPDLLIHKLQCESGTLDDAKERIEAAEEEKLVLLMWNKLPEQFNLKTPIYINVPTSVRRLKREQDVQNLLKCHNVQYRKKSQHAIDETLNRKYRIYIFQQRCVAFYSFRTNENTFITHKHHNVYRQNEQKIELDLNTQSTIEKYVMQKAVQMTYSLGLHFAMIELQLTKERKVEVYNIDPAPILNASLASSFADEIIVYLEEVTRSKSNHVSNILMGMDPELLIRNEQGKVVPSSRFLPRKGKIGSDGVRINDEVKQVLVEFRPDAQFSPEKSFSSLHRLLRVATQHIKDERLSWHAGAMPNDGFYLGGHLHFSGLLLNTDVLSALDHYLALPLSMIEPTTASRRRKRHGYLGDYRRKKHGGFEYRTLASWLVEPTVARGVLELAFFIVTHYRLLRNRDLFEPINQRAFYEGNRELLLPIVQENWLEVEKLMANQASAFFRKQFKRRIFSLRCWDEQQDVRIQWKVGPFN